MSTRATVVLAAHKGVYYHLYREMLDGTTRLEIGDDERMADYISEVVVPEEFVKMLADSLTSIGDDWVDTTT